MEACAGDEALGLEVSALVQLQGQYSGQYSTTPSAGFRLTLSNSSSHLPCCMPILALSVHGCIHTALNNTMFILNEERQV